MNNSISLKAHVNTITLKDKPNNNPTILPQQQALSENTFMPYNVQNLKANFLNFQGSNNTYNLTKITTMRPDEKAYIAKLDKVEEGKLLQDVMKTLVKATPEQRKDFFVSASKIDILEREPVLLMAKIAASMQSGAKLEYGANIQDNWLKRILTHPNFSETDKLNTIIRSCKSTNMGHVVKNENLFINATELGNIPGKENFGHKNMGESKAYGLYTNDMAFLSNYELSINNNGQKVPLKLEKCSIAMGISKYAISAPGLKVDREQVINKAFFDKIKVKNTSDSSKTVKIDLESKIRDIIHVRGMEPPHGPFQVKTLPDNKGYILKTTTDPDRNLGVKIEIMVDGKPVLPEISEFTENALTANISLAAGETKDIEVKVTPLLNEKPFINGKFDQVIPASFKEARETLPEKVNQDTAKITVEGKGNLKEAPAVLNRALSDLELMTNKLNVDGKEYSYIVAGVPRYACLFGRDSIITALELLPINQKLAKDTAELLASYQGKTFEDRYKEDLAKPDVDVAKLKAEYNNKEEAEGKILHELRVGELARKGEIPSTPYYGTVDATPLWLTLIADYHKWTGDDQTVQKLLPNIEKALEWIDKNSPDGFLRFVGTHDKKNAIANQGWKDSEDSIKHLLDKEGKICNPQYPIALAEVQGYVYEAKKNIAELYKKLGQPQKAAQLEKQAEELKQRFNEKYWLENESFIAISLDKDGKAIPSVSTNAGQCLRTGIIDKNKAQLMEKRIMSEDMNSGWGIRTLSKNSKAFDEMSYHNGSIWPHDTSLVAKGLSHKNTASITSDLYQAAATFPYHRIPELYAGFQRDSEDTEIQTYPEACSPQAWSSAALVDLMVSSLGITPDSNNNAIHLQNPVLPENIDKIKIDNIKINKIPVNIIACKNADGVLTIKATNQQNKPLKVSQTNNNFTIYSE